MSSARPQYHPPGFLIDFYLFIVPAALLLVSGCSPGRIVVDRLSDSLGSAAGEVYLTENDPELVREAFPFNLKTIEILLQNSPQNPDLLLSAASGFAMYAYAFVMEDADRLVREDVKEAKHRYRRAQKLLERAREYGLRGLEVQHPGFRSAFSSNPRAAVDVLQVPDVPLMYWTAAAIGGVVSASRGDPVCLVELPRVGYLLEKARQLDPDWNQGALYGALMKYELSRPDLKAEAEKVARTYFQKALELSAGYDCGLYVGLAESVSVRNQDRQEFQELLQQALAVDVDARPRMRLANILAQNRARWLLTQIDDLFYE